MLEAPFCVVIAAFPESWVQLVKEHPGVALDGLLFLLVMPPYWPLSKLAMALRKVRWLNKEITWPGSRRAETPTDNGAGRSGTPPAEAVADMVLGGLKEKIFTPLLILMLLLGGCVSSGSLSHRILPRVFSSVFGRCAVSGWWSV